WGRFCSPPSRSCADAPARDEDRSMKIYFCDLCNESIPQEDLEQNRVTSVRGKMICSRCAPSIAGATGAPGATGAGPVAASAAAVSGSGRLVAVVAVLLAGFGLYLGWNANGR